MREENVIRPILLALLVVACGPTQDPSAPHLKAEVVAILRPFISEHIEAAAIWGGDPHRERAEALLEEILATESSETDAAIAYLMFLYTGEHPGEELLCEAVRRGSRIAPIIEDFSQRLPLTGLEPYPRFMRGSGFLPAEALRLIRAGRTCSEH